MSIAERLKDEGNVLFKQKNYKGANEKFCQAISSLQKVNQNEIKQPTHPNSRLYLNLLTNCALCYLNLKDEESYNKAIEVSGKALVIDPQNLKALYRRGLAYKELGQKLELNNSKDLRLPELYTKAKQDLQKLTLLDMKNEVATQKLSETVKNYYRVRLLAKNQEEEEEKQQADTNVPLKMSQQALKKAARQTQTMENIMKQYKVDEVAKAAHIKIQNDLLTGDLPKTRTEFQKAVKLLEKTRQPFCRFILRLDSKYYSKVNPNFDTLYKLLMALSEPESTNLPLQELGKAVLAITECNSFELLWKSLIPSQKKKVEALLNRLKPVEALTKQFERLKLV